MQGQGPKFYIDIEGAVYPWDEDTITVSQLRVLGNLPTDLPVQEIDLQTNEARASDLLRRAEGLSTQDLRSPQHVAQALQQVDEAIRLRPLWGRAYERRAFLMMVLGEKQKAIQDLSSALDLGIDDPAYAHHLRGTLHEDLLDHDGAIADISSAIAACPSRPDYYYDRARAWHANGNLAEALADVSVALRLEPDHVLSLVRRAKLWQDLDRDDLAMDDLNHAATVSPNNAMVLNERAELRIVTGDYSGAMEDCRVGLEHAGEDE